MKILKYLVCLLLLSLPAYAQNNVKTGNLPDLSPAQSTDKVLVTRGNTTGNVTVSTVQPPPGPSNAASAVLNFFGAWQALTANNVNGIPWYTPFFSAAALLYEISNGLQIDPRYNGALCNTQMLINEYTDHGRAVVTTQGSNIIGSSFYTFQAGVATPGGGGDVGKIISLYLYPGVDIGATTYIASVNTSNNTATLAPGWTASASSGNVFAVFGGGPSDFNTPSLATDDGAAINNASSFEAVYHGSTIHLPPNCLVGRGSINSSTFTPLNIAAGTELVGNDGGTTYGTHVGDTPSTAGAPNTPLYVASNGFPEDPPVGIKFGDHINVAYRNFTIHALPTPYIFGTGQQLACIGTQTATPLGMENILLDHVTVQHCNVGMGIPYGWNFPVSFTGSIAGNQLNITAVSSQNFPLSGGSTFDHVAVGRRITGSGVPANTTILSGPVPSLSSWTTGTYTLSTTSTVSSESMAAADAGIYMQVMLRDSLLQYNGWGWNGDMSDSVVTNTWFSGNVAGGAYVGPFEATAGNCANQFIGGRFEENQNYGGLIFDGACLEQITGTQFQFNSSGGANPHNVGGGAITVLSSQTIYPSVMVSGSMIEGNGGPTRAQITLAGNASGVAIESIQGSYWNFFNVSQQWSQYFLETATGWSGNNVTIDGGELAQCCTVGITNFTAGGTPASFRQATFGQPFIDTSETALSMTSTLGLAINGIARAGTSLDLGNTTSSMIFPSGTTAQRPTGVNGMERFNTSNSQFEAYNGTWSPVGFQNNYLGGLQILNDTTSANTVIDIDPGQVATDDNKLVLSYAGLFTKSTTGWNAGAGGGLIDTGTNTVLSTYYNVFAIGGSGVTPDFLGSTSATSPTLPASYASKGRINCGFKTDASNHILSLKQLGQDECYWGVPTLDYSQALAAATTNVLVTLNVPIGVHVRPHCTYSVSGTSGAVLLYSPDTTPAATTTTQPFTASPGYTYLASTTTGGPANAACPDLVTNTSGQIGMELSLTSTATVSIVTQGWKELRYPPSAPIGIDFYTNIAGAASPQPISITTQSPNEPIVVFLADWQQFNGAYAYSLSDTSSLTWTKRAEVTAGFHLAHQQEWYAFAPTPLTNDILTITTTNASFNAFEIQGMSVAGAASAIFDTAPGLPNSNTATTAGALKTTTTTTTAGDMLISSGVGFQCGFSPTYPPTFNGLGVGGFNGVFNVANRFATGTVLGATTTWTATGGSCGAVSIITDAIQPLGR